MAPNIMLKGFQKAACRSPHTTAPMPLKIVIQCMYERGSSRSLGPLRSVKILTDSSLSVTFGDKYVGIYKTFSAFSPIFDFFHFLTADSKPYDNQKPGNGRQHDEDKRNLREEAMFACVRSCLSFPLTFCATPGNTLTAILYLFLSHCQCLSAEKLSKLDRTVCC